MSKEKREPHPQPDSMLKESLLRRSGRPTFPFNCCTACWACSREANSTSQALAASDNPPVLQIRTLLPCLGSYAARTSIRSPPDAFRSAALPQPRERPVLSRRCRKLSTAHVAVEHEFAEKLLGSISILSVISGKRTW